MGGNSMGTASRTVGRSRAFDLGEIPRADILCMGDFHIGDQHADVDMVREAVAWINGADDRFGIIAGDLLNMATRNSVSFQYGDMSPKDSRELLTRVLGPLAGKGKILAVVTGNHDYRAEKEIGIDPLEWVCTELAIPYFGSEAVVNLSIGHYQHMKKQENGGPRSPVHYIGYVAHGCRGGRMPGGKLNGLMAYRDVLLNADFYIGGHGHDPMIKPDGCMMHSNQGALVYHDQMFMTCGASLDRRIGEGYPSRFVFRPLSKLFPILSISGTKKKMVARTGSDDEL